MRRHAAAIALAVAIWSQPSGAFAVTPDEILNDPSLEARARDISSGLRCMICQNQSIDDSDADLAKDLRVLVRQRLLAGDTNEEVLAYVVSRYGEFVLLRPRFNLRNALLWGAPVLLLVVGGAWIVASARQKKPETPPPLSVDEKIALEDILRKDT